MRGTPSVDWLWFLVGSGSIWLRFQVFFFWFVVLVWFHASFCVVPVLFFQCLFSCVIDSRLCLCTVFCGFVLVGSAATPYGVTLSYCLVPVALAYGSF